jgi:hypothetical protein
MHGTEYKNIAGSINLALASVLNEQDFNYALSQLVKGRLSISFINFLLVQKGIYFHNNQFYSRRNLL